MDQLPLQDRTALVTGASRGIGAETARALDRAGARVALVARSRDGLAKVAAGLGREPVLIRADLREPGAAAEIAASALGVLGSVDILVDNAAAAARPATADTHAAIIDEMLAVNVRVPLLLMITALIPALAERRRARSPPLLDVRAHRHPRRAAYAASKGAIDAATRSLAMELGPVRIRVNSVAPGVVDTAL